MMSGRSTGPLAWVAALLLAAAAAAPAAGQDEPGAIKELDETYKSRGKELVVDVFAPEAPGKYPAVIVLHGHGGPGEGKRSISHDRARRLARIGYVALVPHYFGRLLPHPTDGRKNARSFAMWERAVADAITYAGHRPDVDPRRVGVLAYSLGSSVALGVAGRDKRVLAVVENYGNLPEWEGLDPSRFPPVLILHGDADAIVKVAYARQLDRWLEDAAVPHETQIYPGGGHGFRGEQAADAWARTLAFLDKYVRQTARAGGDRQPAGPDPLR